jgi:hypothetical protein
MTGPPVPPARRTALVVFLAIVSGALLVSGVLVTLRRPVEPDPAMRPLGYMAPLLAAAAAGVTLAIRQRLAERGGRGTIDEWWGRNLSTAIVLWAVCEAAILTGAVSFFLAGGMAGIATAATGLALLLVNAPSFLEPR